MNFDRIRSVVDVETLQQSHVVIVGGAYGLARNLVRCGVSLLTLIDFDHVSASNPARQDFYADQIGRRKIDVTA